MRSAEVEQLIEDLKSDKPRGHVVVQPESQTVVCVEEETTRRITFSAEESKLLFNSAQSVQSLFEALDYPEEVFVELHMVEMDPEVMAELESYASTVDEV